MVVRRLDRAPLDREPPPRPLRERRLTPAPLTIPNVPLPDPAVVVLIGAAGSGKSTWAADRYRRAEVVSSDHLRDVVGSGPADLDASADAFDLLERIVAARIGRGLTTVVDTLGLDAARRTAWRDAARAAGLPAVAVALDTPGEECRRRNAERDRPVPAKVLADQVRRAPRAVSAGLDAEGWDHVEVVSWDSSSPRGSVPNRKRHASRRAVVNQPRHPQRPVARGWCSSCPGSPGARTGWVGPQRWRWRPRRPGSPGWR